MSLSALHFVYLLLRFFFLVDFLIFLEIGWLIGGLVWLVTLFFQDSEIFSLLGSFYKGKCGVYVLLTILFGSPGGIHYTNPSSAYILYG